MSLADLLRSKRAEILAIAARHGASNVRVFGSVARGEDDSESDIDVLVDLEPGRTLLDQAGLMLDLEACLGHKVDVAVDGGLRDRVRERVLADAVPL
jgi:uncharacterized protein